MSLEKTSELVWAWTRAWAWAWPSLSLTLFEPDFLARAFEPEPRLIAPLNGSVGWLVGPVMTAKQTTK